LLISGFRRLTGKALKQPIQ